MEAYQPHFTGHTEIQRLENNRPSLMVYRWKSSKYESILQSWQFLFKGYIKMDILFTYT